jgi:acyl-CoA hydrolase
MKSFETYKLIKGQDMNHHETLFAGRLAEWFAESTFMGASQIYGKYGELDHLVAVEVHSLKFLGPTFNGDIIRFISTGIQAGKTSLTVYTKALRNNTDVLIADGFVTFVCVDGAKQKIPHNIVIDDPETEEEKKLLERFNKIKG